MNNNKKHLGVTTIAGGYSQKPGKKDGPAQNASFSNDYRLTFVPERCALFVSDYANKLIRQINLKPEDCARNYHWGKYWNYLTVYTADGWMYYRYIYHVVGFCYLSGLGMSSAWALVLGLSCLLLGLVVGFLSRPYVITSRVSVSCIGVDSFGNFGLRIHHQTLTFVDREE